MDRAVNSIDTDRVADEATLQAFLNCYLREIGATDWLRTNDVLAAPDRRRNLPPWTLRCYLQYLDVELLFPASYVSLTWRNRFDFPAYYRHSSSNKLRSLDCVSAAVFLCQQLIAPGADAAGYQDLVGRVIDSRCKTALFLDARRSDLDRLFSSPLTYIEAEQSLLLGHALHPAPKSRQNVTDEDLLHYSPESGGAFPLYYYRVHRDLVLEASHGDISATRLVAEQLFSDPALDDDARGRIGDLHDWAVVPVHPRQADILRRSAPVEALYQQGLIEELGPLGSPYQATISVRTVYRRNADFMYKLSLGIDITNSRRMNLFKELERGLEITRLLETGLGKELNRLFPALRIITDPAYLTVTIDGEVLDDFSTVLRSNPFPVRQDSDVYAVTALCQLAPDGKRCHLAREIGLTASRERRAPAAVALDWLDLWLANLVEPILWLYSAYGLALEPHQQNTLVRIEAGYPGTFYYRDNQGYYYCASRMAALENLMPGIGEISETACADETVAERLGYYLFVNNICGLVNTLGITGCLDEARALARVREYLSACRARYSNLDLLLDPLLEGYTIRCKSNLLTRLHQMDELVGPVANQSVYVDIHNPLMDVGYA